MFSIFEMFNKSLSVKVEHPFDKDEQEVSKIIRELLKKYRIPLYTSQIKIDKDVIPHSHPILTLNTRPFHQWRNNLEKARLAVLAQFVHENVHWFEDNHPQLKKCMDYLKEKYSDIRDNDEFPEEKSFFIHIIVCFNTLQILEQILTQEEIQFIYHGNFVRYPKIEQFIKKNMKKLEKDLKKFDMIIKRRLI